MRKVLHETCPQYVARRLSEGWRIAGSWKHLVFLSPPEGNFIRVVDLRNDVETLRPSGAGAETSISFQTPDSTFHWDKVDEVIPDGDTTRVWNGYEVYERDLYSLPASSGSGAINFIKIYITCRLGYIGANAYGKVSLRSNSTVTDGTEHSNPGSSAYVTYSQQWNTNPAPPGTDAWTWADIDALQIGVSLKMDTTDSRCTQVYVEVDYTPPAWQGKIAGVTNPAKIMGVDVANIETVKGVASA